MKYRNRKSRLLSVVGAMAAIAAIIGTGPALSQGAPGISATNPIVVNCPTRTSISVSVFSQRDVHFRIGGDCFCRQGPGGIISAPNQVFPSALTKRASFQTVLSTLGPGGLGTLPVQFQGKSMTKADFVAEQTIGFGNWLNNAQSFINPQYIRNLDRAIPSAVSVGQPPQSETFHCYPIVQLQAMHNKYKDYAAAVVALIEFFEQNP